MQTFGPLSRHHQQKAAAKANGVAMPTLTPVFGGRFPSHSGFLPDGQPDNLAAKNTVTLLPNGKVLILGGLTATRLCCFGVEIQPSLFDPAQAFSRHRQHDSALGQKCWRLLLARHAHAAVAVEKTP